MERNDFQFIQDQIGYTFKNTDLLQQAFVRRSYSKENGGEDNEVLEFIGDKVLDFIVVKLLAEQFGYYLQDCDDFNPEEEWNEFACEHNEGKLTEIKRRMVEKETLSKQIDTFGFADFLILGKGDAKNHIERQSSVKEDLFESILGAVALDSQWNIDDMQSVVEIMLNPDDFFENSDDNYVQIIQDWTNRHSNMLPSYSFGTTFHTSFPVQGWSMQAPQCVYDSSKLRKSNDYPICCYMHIADDLPEFWGLGKSKSKARKDACLQAYQYLDKHDLLWSIQDEIEDPNEMQAINQLETLARRGYFSIPVYDFELQYDSDGNPIWYCECHIKEHEDFYWAKDSSKKSAKKSAAFGMLQSVLE